MHIPELDKFFSYPRKIHTFLVCYHDLKMTGSQFHASADAQPLILSVVSYLKFLEQQ